MASRRTPWKAARPLLYCGSTAPAKPKAARGCPGCGSIDVSLDPAHVYKQVFAQAAGQRGILDLLCITRLRRLAILELKATENLDLPLQAADYWSRIRRHRAQGNLARYGYFTGIELQSAAPLVYLVAPSLRFHPSTDALLRYLSPEMEIIRVGLAESWRRGLRIMIRQ
jgi:hypothetical protein